MRNHTCLLDHHQRSHYDTIPTGLKGMINRVLQLNISQLESSFNSLLEKRSTVDQQPEGKVVRQSRGEVQHATFSQLTQPIQKPICDRSGQPEDTQGVFVVKGETSR